ncbi:MAG: molybdenum ABC transporter ATP-binding protein [Rhodocyclaceae bacterium]
MAAAELDACGIHARFQVDYPGFRLAVDARLPGRGVTALFGHSGSGKTTLLRCIAGLERAPGGYLEVNGEVWQDDTRDFHAPTHRRALGYVFQEASLFPHLSVRRNLDYGLKRVDGRVRRVVFDQAVDLLGIEALLERAPDRLSGGERQRVAIARALLTSPRLLLMDEPLAALDLRRKLEILPYLERLHDELSIPVLYVSHSPDEVARLADYLVLLDAGRVAAAGPLADTLARLDLPPVFADDAGVVLDTVIAQPSSAEDADNLTKLDFPGGAIFVSRRPEAPGRRMRCRIHARDVSLTLQRQTDTSILNLVPATVVEIGATDNPAHVLVRLDAGGSPLVARITARSCRALGLAPGAPVWAQIKAVALLG